MVVGDDPTNLRVAWPTSATDVAHRPLRALPSRRYALERAMLSRLATTPAEALGLSEQISFDAFVIDLTDHRANGVALAGGIRRLTEVGSTRR
jgi:hypothetical protein